MAPWNLLLLDEVTVDLDVLVRTRLLAFLKEETIERKATVLYATHICMSSLFDLNQADVVQSTAWTISLRTSVTCN